MQLLPEGDTTGGFRPPDVIYSLSHMKWNCKSCRDRKLSFHYKASNESRRLFQRLLFSCQVQLSSACAGGEVIFGCIAEKTEQNPADYVIIKTNRPPVRAIRSVSPFCPGRAKREEARLPWPERRGHGGACRARQRTYRKFCAWGFPKKSEVSIWLFSIMSPAGMPEISSSTAPGRP